MFVPDPHIPKGEKIPTKPIRNTGINFSWRYYKQIDDFGLIPADRSWHASLLDRLSELSRIDLSQFNNHAYRDNLRYHAVDWSKAPIKRTDLTWIDKNVIENDDEFIFYQFHISRAKGRFVGYWQEDVFNIVLLDPMHNMHPSKYTDYKIRPAGILGCQYSTLLKSIETIKNKVFASDDCVVCKAILTLPKTDEESNAVIAFLDESYLNALNKIMETKTFTEFMEISILNDE